MNKRKALIQSIISRQNLRKTEINSSDHDFDKTLYSFTNGNRTFDFETDRVTVSNVSEYDISYEGKIRFDMFKDLDKGENQSSADSWVCIVY